jgi:hypothetical protein
MTSGLDVPFQSIWPVPGHRDNTWAEAKAILACSTLLALALTLAIPGSSLWTDEAFSAWVVGHRTFGAVARALLAGESSDLQTGAYYLYLFCWTKLFGAGEFALRTANIPVIALFSFTLVKTSWIVFRSRTAWIVAGLCPFVWYYAGEARPYMASLAFSAAACGALLAFVTESSRSRVLPWITLSCVALGVLFHMLFVLVLPPLLVIAATSTLPRARWRDARWREWIGPLCAFTPVFGLIAGFLAFTFARGTSYTYPKPGLFQIFSLVYQSTGLNAFGPNRVFSLDPHPYVVPLSIGCALLLLAAAFLLLCCLRARPGSLVPPLMCAAVMAVIEVPAIELVTRTQLDARHLAAVVPIFLLLIMAAITAGPLRSRRLASVLLSAAWLIALVRQASIIDYAREDYKGAVRTAIRLQKETGAEIAVFADSAGAAYYGLDMQGPAPCVPMRSACADAYHQVPWPRITPAVMAEHWDRNDINTWLSGLRERHAPGLVVVQLSRARAGSPWPEILRTRSSPHPERLHGFEIHLIPSQD